MTTFKKSIQTNDNIQKSIRTSDNIRNFENSYKWRLRNSDKCMSLEFKISWNIGLHNHVGIIIDLLNYPS